MKNSNNNDSTYYPYFDYLRACCAIAVMFYHAHLFTWEHSGSLAVQVFFALSGWLIGGILIDTKPEQLFRFYFNRAIRIWLPYYLALGIFLTLSVLREPITPKWIEIVVYKITFVYNIFGTPQLAQFAQSMPEKGTLNHVWSVNAEEQFYLVASLIMVIGGRYFGKHAITWIVISIAALTFNIYPAIVLGVLAAIISKQLPNLQHFLSKYRLGLLLATLILTPMLANNFLYSYISPIFSISLVLLLVIPGKENYFGKIAGGMSYPLYLNHWLGVYAINFIAPSIRNTFTSAILSSAISIAFAVAMYLYIDKKVLAKRDDWYSRRLGTAAALAAYAMISIGLVYGFAKVSF